MNWNFESVLIAKEITEWEFVTPTKGYSVKSSSINTKNETQELSQIEGTIFSPTTIIEGKKSITWSLESFANTEILGIFLTWALWNPTTTSSGSVFTHSYDVSKYWLPSYTVETTKWTTINRSSGVKVNTLTITNEDSAINVSADLVWLKGIDSERVIDVSGVGPYIISFGWEVFFSATDTVDLRSSNWNLLESEIPVISVIDSKTIEIDTVSTTVEWGMIISLTKRTPVTTADKRPLRFYGDTSVTIEKWSTSEKDIWILNLSLVINNNIKVDEGYRSGSYYSRTNEQWSRTVEWSFTIYTEDLPSFVAAHKNAQEILVNFILEWDTVDWISSKSLEVEWLVLITDVPVNITAGETITSSVSFKFTNVSKFNLKDWNASY